MKLGLSRRSLFAICACFLAGMICANFVLAQAIVKLDQDGNIHRPDSNANFSATSEATVVSDYNQSNQVLKTFFIR